MSVIPRIVAGFGDASKWCPKCREYLTLGSFWKNKATKDGLTKYCAECCKAYDAENPDQARLRYKRAGRRKKPWGTHSKATAEKAVDQFISGDDSPVEDLNTEREKELLARWLEDRPEVVLPSESAQCGDRRLPNAPIGVLDQRDDKRRSVLRLQV